MPPAATVVVPTRDRPESLRGCLAALARQTLSPLEVLVVDDGSVDAAATAVVAERAGVGLLRRRHAGAGPARNAAVAAARANVVLFTDDDCEPAPSWAAHLVDAIGAGAAAVAGRTVNAFPESRLASASHSVVEFVTERALRPGLRTGFAPSMNIACRKEVLAEVPFPASYCAGGRGGEDRHWCAALAEAGHALVYVPEAIVAHRQRLGLGAFCGQHYRYGRGAYRFRRSFPATRALEPARFYADLVRRGFAGGGAEGALVVVSQVATACGYAREAFAVHATRNAV